MQARGRRLTGPYGDPVVRDGLFVIAVRNQMEGRAGFRRTDMVANNPAFRSRFCERLVARHNESEKFSVPAETSAPHRPRFATRPTAGSVLPGQDFKRDVLKSTLELPWAARSEGWRRYGALQASTTIHGAPDSGLQMVTAWPDIYSNRYYSTTAQRFDRRMIDVADCVPCPPARFAEHGLLRPGIPGKWERG